MLTSRIPCDKGLPQGRMINGQVLSPQRMAQGDIKETERESGQASVQQLSNWAITRQRAMSYSKGLMALSVKG